MRKTIHPLPFRRRTRRGSILILVVAVLVLLALMGTAYMSVARIDRLASGPLNDATPEEVLEQLVPAVKTMVNDTIVKDVNITTTGNPIPMYRPCSRSSACFRRSPA